MYHLPTGIHEVSQRDKVIIDTLEHHHRILEITEISVLVDNSDPCQ